MAYFLVCYSTYSSVFELSDTEMMKSRSGVTRSLKWQHSIDRIRVQICLPL